VRRGLEQALDDYLVLLSQSGSREAFGRLAARWSPRLTAFATRTLGTEMSHDVMQDTWEAALRGLRGLEDPARFPAWIYAIAARKCADVLRGRYRGKRLTAALAREPIEAPATIATADAFDLAVALKQLPPDQRVAVSLFFGEDMSVADIAAVTGVPPGTVKSRLFAARRTLRASMEGDPL